MYNFLFDKKSLILLLSGLGLTGLLLFCAGLLVGVQVGLPTTASYTPPRPPAAKLPAKAAFPEDRPCTPAADLAAAPPEPAVPELAPEVEEAPPEPEPVPAVAAPQVQVAALPAPPPVAVTADDAAFTLQIGAFRKAENSDKVIRDLASRGYQPYVVALKGSRSRVLHTVRVGRYADRGEAQKAAAELRQRAGIAAVVVGS